MKKKAKSDELRPPFSPPKKMPFALVLYLPEERDITGSSLKVLTYFQIEDAVNYMASLEGPDAFFATERNKSDKTQHIKGINYEVTLVCGIGIAKWTEFKGVDSVRTSRNSSTHNADKLAAKMLLELRMQLLDAVARKLRQGDKEYQEYLRLRKIYG